MSVVQHGGGVSSIVHSGRFSDSPVSDILKFADPEVISVIGHHMRHDRPSQLVQRQDVFFSLFFLLCSSLLLPEQMARSLFSKGEKKRNHLRTKITNIYLFWAQFQVYFSTLLMNCLETVFDISGNVLKWFRSYLTGRRQFVALGECRSDFGSVSTGIPQGSMLGPLLFRLYLLFFLYFLS